MKRFDIRFILLFLMLILMLNSAAVWAFSLFSYVALSFLYLVNFLPFLMTFSLLKWQSAKKHSNLGFIFLFTIFCRVSFVLIALWLFDKNVGISKIFLGNFIIVYLIFLYLNVFIGARLLSERK